MKILHPMNYPMVMLAATVMILNSCATTSNPITKRVNAANKSTRTATNWYLVKEHPPTFFPKGYAVDSPSSSDDGEWLYSGAYKARWFIPNKGANGLMASTLRKEASALRRAEQNNGTRHRKLGRMSVELPVRLGATVVVVLGGMLGATPSDDIFEVIWTDAFD